MKVYEFGDRCKPILVLIPGTCCHWKNTFGKVIEGRQKSFFVACVSFDGFDETEETVFPTETEETARIEGFITAHYVGRVCAVYGCSLGGSIVGLMAAHGKIHMDYGILGASDLDQSGKETCRQAANSADVEAAPAAATNGTAERRWNAAFLRKADR